MNCERSVVDRLRQIVVELEVGEVFLEGLVVRVAEQSASAEVMTVVRALRDRVSSLAGQVRLDLVVLEADRAGRPGDDGFSLDDGPEQLDLL